jgi:hypothetical protein
MTEGSRELENEDVHRGRRYIKEAILKPKPKDDHRGTRYIKKAILKP